MGAHVPRAPSEWAAARGLSASQLLFDIRAAYYSVCRGLAVGPTLSDEDADAVLDRCGVSPAAMEELAEQARQAWGIGGGGRSSAPQGASGRDARQHVAGGARRHGRGARVAEFRGGNARWVGRSKQRWTRHCTTCDCLDRLRAVVVTAPPRERAHVAEALVEARPPDGEAALQVAGGRLPAYMLPAFLVDVEEWPRTSSGKIDRKRLPLPDAATVGEEDFAPPQDDTERAVVAAMAEVLGLSAEQIGVRSDFFRLGGSSLSALRLMQRLASEFPDTRLHVREFHSPCTPAGLSQLLRGRHMLSFHGAQAPASSLSHWARSL